MYFSGGGSPFQSNLTLASYATEPKLAVGNVDGSGYDDIVVVTFTNTVDVFFSGGITFTTSATPSVPAFYSFSSVSLFRLGNNSGLSAVFATANELVFTNDLYLALYNSSNQFLVGSTPTCTNASQLFVTTWKRQVSIVAQCVDGLRYARDWPSCAWRHYHVAESAGFFQTIVYWKFQCQYVDHQRFCRHHRYEPDGYGRIIRKLAATFLRRMALFLKS